MTSLPQALSQIPSVANCDTFLLSESAGTRGAGVGSPQGAGSFPCLLFSHISTENSADQPKSALQLAAQLTTRHRRSVYILSQSVELLARKYGLSQLGFLTLTFRDHVTCPKEAQRRLNSLISHVIKQRYRSYLGVFERQKSGRIHYHLLVVLRADIRTGFDFQAIADQDYRSACPALRAEWAFLRRTAPSYGFGRTELLPVKSSSTAIAKYVGKYIGKHMDSRTAHDKGIRLVRYARNARAGTSHFQFLSVGSREWRRKVAVFAGIVQARYPETTILGVADLARVVGHKWSYNNRAFIMSL